jgi:hypothetical protein
MESADSILCAVTKGGSSETRGLALVALSTLAYGIQPLFGKAAYAGGVAPLTLLA